MSKKYILKKNIIDGYNGIMDLDLTNIPKLYHHEMIQLHNKDIEIYKIEQLLLPEKLRFENTVQRAYNTIKTDREALVKNKNKYSIS